MHSKHQRGLSRRYLITSAGQPGGQLQKAVKANVAIQIAGLQSSPILLAHSGRQAESCRSLLRFEQRRGYPG